MKKLLAVVTDETALAEMYAEGLIGTWNGAREDDGTFVVAIDIKHGLGKQKLSEHPAVTLLPSRVDPGAKVKQEHMDKLPTKLKQKAKADMTGRELAALMHETYRDVTLEFDPDI